MPYWHHSIDLGDGVVTPGLKGHQYHDAELELLHLPDLEGKSVLDIGTWDGFYAFEAGTARRCSRRRRRLVCVGSGHPRMGARE